MTVSDLIQLLQTMPRPISERVNRLKAAHADTFDDHLNGMGSKRELALMAKLEAAYAECEQLRAKIAELERQKPVGTALLCARCSTPFDDNHYCPACEYHTATEEYVYALPGAKGEEK